MKKPSREKLLKDIQNFKAEIEVQLVYHPADPNLLDALESCNKSIKILEEGKEDGK